ncbi:solute carrier family 2, facilitated glucose transporter member 8-like [Amblyomma americanum]
MKTRFGSLMTLGAVFGSLVGAVLAQRYGRRWSFLTAALGLLATWLCIGLAEHVYLSYVARFVNGFFTGFVSLVVPAHIAEMAFVTHRGTNGATHHLVITLGMLYAFAIGRFLDWDWLALCCVLPPLLLLLLTGVVVESPRWLLQHHRHQRAFQALLKVRCTGHQAEAEVEFDAIRAIFTKYNTPVAHYVMSVLVMAVQQASGVNCIMLSATSIAPTQQATNGLVLLALLQSVVSALAVPFLDLVGRRKVIVVSVIVCSTSLISLGFVYYTTPTAPPMGAGAAASSDHSPYVEPLATASTLHMTSPLTFACMAFFVAGYSVGLGPVPWILAAELTPLRNTGMELGSVCAANWASCFVTANFFSTASTMQLLGVTLWLYSGVTLTGGLFFLALLPETAHSSIEEILLIGQDVQHEPKDKRRRSKSDLTPGQEQPAAPKDDAEPSARPPQQGSRATGIALGPAIDDAPEQPQLQRSTGPGLARLSAASRRSTACKTRDASKRTRGDIKGAQ